VGYMSNHGKKFWFEVLSITVGVAIYELIVHPLAAAVLPFVN
jgi:hypothetical protein